MTITIFLTSLLGAMTLGMPIAFALLVCGVALMLQLGNFDTQILAQNLLEGTNNYPLMAVPFFMLAGELMNAGGISRRIIALAEVLIPLMRSAGYSVPRSAGLIAAGGIIAPIIPPSIGFVIFGVAAQVSITKLFLAGIVPGVLMGVSLWAAWWFCARREAPPVADRKFEWDRLHRALVDGVWALVLPVIIIGGMKFGVFTPT